MKHIFTSIISIAFISSCTQVNSTGEKAVTQGNDTVSDVNISLSKIDAIEELSDIKEEESKLVFKAEGSEPGWTAEFYTDKVTVVLNYGKETLTLKRHNTDLNKSEDVKINLQSGVSDMMVIKNKSCNAMSGETYEKRVEITYKGKLYKGCGRSVN